MFQVKISIANMLSSFPAARTAVVATVLSAGAAFAQPPVPTTPDIVPSATPTGAALNETIEAAPDAEGYTPIFDKTGKGWWHSNQTTHSGGSAQGAVFRITEVNGEAALYTNDRSGGVGGILMTKKKYAHYELIFDFWPDYGNDGGIFNRTTPQGKCFQTVLDYIGSASVGGTWGEAGFVSRDIRPWTYSNENTIAIPAGNNGWTYVTSKENPSSYGCAASGCVQADYLRLWDVDGWNQIKIKFYGGSQSGEGPIRMLSWFRKVGATPWVPIIKDTTLNQIAEPSFIGIQVHGGNRYQGDKGSWFKNIKIKELDSKGVPLISGLPRRPDAKISHHLVTKGDFLTGSVAMDYEMEVRDVLGNLRETFQGRAGKFTHALKPATTGLLLVRVKTAVGAESTRILRVRD